MHSDDTTAGSLLENPYEAEAKERWGNTEAWAQSKERVKAMTKEDMARLKEAGDTLMTKIAAVRDHDPADTEVQKLIAEHFNGLRAFYEPSLEMYRGLADLYVSDPRFTANLDKYGEGTAAFLRKAMHAYCDLQEPKK